MDKPTEDKKPDALSPDQSQTPEPENAEIDEKELDNVSGGRMPLKPLNPQPLPPFWEA